MMASIQTSFAVMPALVYLFAGLVAERGLDRHRRRLHDAADAAVLADPALLNVGVDIQTSTALFDRVFEYLDLPVDIHQGTRELHGVRGEVALRRRLVPLRLRADAAGDRRSTCPPGTRTALVGETGSGKTTLGYLAARLYDPDRGAVRLDGTDLRELTLRLAGRRRRRRLAGDLPVPRQRAREPALRAAGRDRRGDRGGGARRADPRHDRGAARGLRHRRRRARLPLLRRREAADRDRAHDPAQPAGARARRGDQRARRADRARGRRGARASSPRAARRS